MYKNRFIIGVLLALFIAIGLLSAASTLDAAAPTLTLLPSSGTIGTKVAVCVYNMTPGSTIGVGNITFAGAPWNTSPIFIDPSGSVCAVLLTVPVTTAGAKAVVVSDGILTVSGVFTVTQPTISISPTSGYKGETMTVSGSGWPQGTPGSVTVTFAGAQVKLATPDANGYFSVQFAVPLTAGSSNLVGAFDVLGNTAPSQTFSLKPAGLTLNPTNGLPGTSAVANGVGFQPHSSVDQLKLGSVNILPSLGLTTNEVGAFTAIFTVPGLPAGGYTVSATVAGVTLTICFTINETTATTPLNPTPAFPIEQSLASIKDKLVRVWGYYAGDWQMYDPADVLGSTLAGLTSGRGYWVKVNEDCTLIFRNLTKGWNLVGW